MTTQSRVWDGDVAIAHMARVQLALDLKGLGGHDPRVHALMGKTVAAFRARDIVGVERSCEETLRAIERVPKPPTKPVPKGTRRAKPPTPDRATG